jgi:hypothetical protein
MTTQVLVMTSLPASAGPSKTFPAIKKSQKERTNGNDSSGTDRKVQLLQGHLCPFVNSDMRYFCAS